MAVKSFEVLGIGLDAILKQPRLKEKPGSHGKIREDARRLSVNV